MIDAVAAVKLIQYERAERIPAGGGPPSHRTFFRYHTISWRTGGRKGRARGGSNAAFPRAVPTADFSVFTAGHLLTIMATADGPLDVTDLGNATPGDANLGGKHVTWDEAALAEHRACAGVLYGTQRIEESTTPFLYYSESVSRSEKAIGEFVPGKGISIVSIEALQERLGVLAFAQSLGDELRLSAAADRRPLPPPPWPPS